MWVTCVGVTDDKSGGAFSNSLDEGPHLGGPQSAVQTDAGAHEGGVRDNVPASRTRLIGRLTTEGWRGRR